MWINVHQHRGLSLLFPLLLECVDIRAKNWEAQHMRSKNRRDIEDERYEFISLIRILRDYNPKKYNLFIDTLETLRGDDTISEDLVDDWILARMEVEG